MHLINTQALSICVRSLVALTPRLVSLCEIVYIGLFAVFVPQLRCLKNGITQVFSNMLTSITGSCITPTSYMYRALYVYNVFMHYANMHHAYMHHVY